MSSQRRSDTIASVLTPSAVTHVHTVSHSGDGVSHLTELSAGASQRCARAPCRTGSGWFFQSKSPCADSCLYHIIELQIKCTRDRTRKINKISKTTKSEQKEKEAGTRAEVLCCGRCNKGTPTNILELSRSLTKSPSAY